MTTSVLAGKHVMVAEDELLVAMMIEDILADNQCVLLGPFTNVRDALMAAKDLSIDVAVLDVNLKGQKIYPVAEVLANRGIAFFLISGYGRDAIPPEHPEWQVCPKPFSIEQMTAMLEEHVIMKTPP